MDTNKNDLITPEELTEEEQSSVAGGAGSPRLCPECGAPMTKGFAGHPAQMFFYCNACGWGSNKKK